MSSTGSLDSLSCLTPTSFTTWSLRETLSDMNVDHIFTWTENAVVSARMYSENTDSAYFEENQKSLFVRGRSLVTDLAQPVSERILRAWIKGIRFSDSERLSFTTDRVPRIISSRAGILHQSPFSGETEWCRWGEGKGFIAVFDPSGLLNSRKQSDLRVCVSNSSKNVRASSDFQVWGKVSGSVDRFSQAHLPESVGIAFDDSFVWKISNNTSSYQKDLIIIHCLLWRSS